MFLLTHSQGLWVALPAISKVSSFLTQSWDGWRGWGMGRRHFMLLYKEKEIRDTHLLGVKGGTATHTQVPLGKDKRGCYGGHKLFPKYVLNVGGHGSCHPLRLPAGPLPGAIMAHWPLPAVTLCMPLEPRSSRKGHPSHQLQQAPNPAPMLGLHGHPQSSSGASPRALECAPTSVSDWQHPWLGEGRALLWKMQ